MWTMVYIFLMFVRPPRLHVTVWLINKPHSVCFPPPPFCGLGILCYLPPILHPNVLPPLLLDLSPLSSSSLAPPHHIYLLSFVYRLILLVLQSIYTYLEIKFDFLGPFMYIVRNNGWKRKLRPAELCQICGLSLNTWQGTKIAFLRIRLLKNEGVTQVTTLNMWGSLIVIFSQMLINWCSHILNLEICGHHLVNIWETVTISDTRIF